MTRTMLVDNYDSFTYNLFELLTAVNGQRPIVVRNDAAWGSLPLDRVDNIVISPGPGSPEKPGDFGICERILAESTLPILGVCLGHQGLCANHGARVVRAPEPMHGRITGITHTGTGLFEGLPSPLSVVRYHSLAVVDLPDDLEATAWTDDGVLMAVQHRSLPRWGVQFHPESIGSDGGHRLLANFRDATAAPLRVVPPAPMAAPTPPARYTVEHLVLDRDLDPTAVYEAVVERAPKATAGRFWIDGSARTEPASRFSVIGDCTGPRAQYVTYDVSAGTVRIRDAHGEQLVTTPFFDYLDRALREATITPDTQPLPFDFRLGFVGYLGYELKAETGGAAAHRSPDPDAALVFADRAIVLDHAGGQAYALCLTEVDVKADGTADLAAHQWLAETIDILSELPAAVPDSGRRPAAISTRPCESTLSMRHSHDGYVARIEESLELIRAGETYEVCLTNAISVQARIDPLTTFDHLRAISPVPYAALLEFDDVSVVSTSPERFLRIFTDGTVESKPIKGTRPRGQSADADLQMRSSLITSEKDRAENLMIVDLVRNDLSRVCTAGSVHVPTLFGIETYASVHQMVSTVRGVLAPGASAVDCLRATFPGGSMTGAPKIRTMEIIDRLEGGARGLYSGSIGYLSLNGAADLSIVIRTLVVDDDRVRFGTGGAITALSDPEEEFQETLVKASTLQRVLELAPASVESHRPALRPIAVHSGVRRPPIAGSRR